MADRVEPTWAIDASGRWIDTGSGPGYSPPEDTRPEYSPAALILDVLELLADQDIIPVAQPNMMLVASHAAADLLRALGVRPANAPLGR